MVVVVVVVERGKGDKRTPTRALKNYQEMVRGEGKLWHSKHRKLRVQRAESEK
jgi:hypothetical protein